MRCFPTFDSRLNPPHPSRRSEVTSQQTRYTIANFVVVAATATTQCHIRQSLRNIVTACIKLMLVWHNVVWTLIQAEQRSDNMIYNRYGVGLAMQLSELIGDVVAGVGVCGTWRFKVVWPGWAF